MIALLASTAVLANQDVTFDLKLSTLSKLNTEYKMNVEVDQNGTTMAVELRWLTKYATLDDKGGKLAVTWGDLTVEGNSMGDQGPWEFIVDKDGVVTEATEGDEYRRMINPYTFTFPGSAKVGQEWSNKLTPKSAKDREIEWTFKAEAVEKIGDQETLKVTSKMKEKGDNGMTSDGTWWVRKDGKFQKFKFEVKNWVVPMAGEESFSAKVTGELKG